MMHDPCIIVTFTIVVPTNAHKHVKISLYILRTPTRFGQPCGHVQGYKIQRLDTFKISNGIIKLLQPIQRCYYNHMN